MVCSPIKKLFLSTNNHAKDCSDLLKLSDAAKAIGFKFLGVKVD